MKAVVVQDFNEDPTFRVGEISVPELGPDDARIMVHAAPVNFGDVVIITGQYQVKPTLPFIGGAECAGIVEAVGANVTSVSIGDRVSANGFVGDSRGGGRLLGAYAEKVVVSAAMLQPVPDFMDLTDASMFGVSYETSYYALVDRGRLRAGEVLLVLGASGASGYAAVQIGKALGATVVAAASSPAKQALSREAGADFVISSRADDLRGEVAAAIGRPTIDMVFDPVGGAVTEPLFRMLAAGGRYLVIGFAGGAIASLPLNLALLKDASLVGVNNNRFQEQDRAGAAANRQALYALHRDGALPLPTVRRCFALDDFADAFALVQNADGPGRVIIRPA